MNVQDAQKRFLNGVAQTNPLVTEFKKALGIIGRACDNGSEKVTIEYCSDAFQRDDIAKLANLIQTNGFSVKLYSVQFSHSLVISGWVGT